jgi:NUMOD3 motif
MLMDGMMSNFLKNTMSGKHRSEETRKKMSEAAKKRWQRKRTLPGLPF